MEFHDQGIIISLRKYGEYDAVIDLMTAEHGRHAGLVKGGMGRRQRGTLQPGNEVMVSWRGRLENQLGTYAVELRNARSASFLNYPSKLGVLNSACAILSVTLMEREAHPALYKALQILLDTLERVDDRPENWGALLVQWEIGLLAELGFGLDFSCCAATGVTEDLVYISPKSGRAVSREAGAPYHDKMLNLPKFLCGGGEINESDIRDGLHLSEFFLERYVLQPNNKKIPQARRMLLDYLTY
ncbi:DNA repair protein RecO [Paremcibacter congregatus]|mgnify:CR=1 FL=1|uniref:DNA repair protein RecO n=1 Tax=Paremcibacter congregatus TaxID=2043170 RepID=UPI0030EBB4BC|tara:strand:- start:8690 stop:9418 length:729 start_codon:yes stop_codon:yes gene_type:complete